MIDVWYWVEYNANKIPQFMAIVNTVPFEFDELGVPILEQRTWFRVSREWLKDRGIKDFELRVPHQAKLRTEDVRKWMRYSV